MATLSSGAFGGLLGGLVRTWRRVAMAFSRPPAYAAYLPQIRADFARSVGEVTDASVVMAPLMWIARTFPEAPVAVWRQLPDGQMDPVIGHPLAKLIRRPNPFFSGEVLWMATVVDWATDGNAYWIKIRNRAGAVRELWWAPRWTMEPVAPSDGSEYIESYAYTPQGTGAPFAIPVEDVVHFRFGLDPADMRKGFSPLKAVLSEIFTDEEASRFTATLLRNMGVPGLVISPADSNAAPADDKDLEATKRYLREAFTGEYRGEPIVFSAPTKIEQFGFSPEQLLLRDLRRIPEERVSAVLGVPAIVAGLGAGLDRSTFTNMTEAREMAYESNIIPTQRLMAAEISARLLPDFEREPDAFVAGFDLSQVRVLQEDRLKVVQRATTAVGGGLMKLAEGRREIGLPVGPEDDIYLRPVNLVAVGTGEAAPALGASAEVLSAIAGVRQSAAALEDLLAGASANGNGGSGDA